MAKIRARSTVSAPTATSRRSTRIPSLVGTPAKAKKKVSSGNASATEKKRGRPTSSKVMKVASTGAKKEKRGLSVVTTAKKQRISARMKQRSVRGAEASKDRSETRLPHEAPEPEEVYNDELKSKGLEYEAEKIYNSRLDNNGGREYLVKWVGWRDKYNTWEPEVNLRNSLELIQDFDREFPNAA